MGGAAAGDRVSILSDEGGWTQLVLLPARAERRGARCDLRGAEA